MAGKEPKNNTGKPERKVVTNAEKGLQVCGAKNKFLQPCQRIGVCPFHPPKGEDGAKPPESASTKKRKAAALEAERRANLSAPPNNPKPSDFPPAEHKENRDKHPYRPIFPEDYPPQQYSRTEYLPRKEYPISHTHNFHHTSEFRSTIFPSSYPAPHFPPPATHIPHPPPLSYEEVYYPRPYFPGSQYRRRYDYQDESDRRPALYEGQTSRYGFEAHRHTNIFPSPQFKENEEEKNRESPLEKESLRNHPAGESNKESLPPILNSQNSEIEEGNLPPIWSYIRGSSKTTTTG
eukprot:TRINITY_DN3674_c0_g1_i1.p1 TRINITY_DN3674_c0_g1~~TRINITY_DN3674_c0_g1_i1.p1  ORF type:complete len:292 (+),score=69.38 TRINITY_DN3674_c0_g1_i1:241-1116(+)